MLKKDSSLFSYIKKLLEKQSFTIIEAYFKLYSSNFSTLVSDKFGTWLFLCKCLEPADLFVKECVICT